MVVDRTLYDILEVEPNATPAQIKRAVQTKSLEHHPDRGGSHEMMQKVNAAKEILTDAEKRKLYDQRGLEGMKSHMGDDHSPFSGFPGGFANIFNMFNQGRSQRDTNDTKHALKVSLEELYSGSTKKISINRKVVCTDCKGTGAHDGISRECTSCEGTGVETLVYRMGPMIQQMQGKCSSCHGRGNTINPSNRCKSCNGQKLCRKTKILDVNIVHGSQHGESIKFIGEGDQDANGKSGTVYIILQQQPHDTFDRNGDDLKMKLRINLAESLCGFQRLITLLDGHTILITHPAGKPIAPNSYRCLKGYGMPNRNSHSHGDLIINFDVTFPEANFITTENQRQQLEALLPPKTPIKLNGKQLYEESEMMDCTPAQENAHNKQQNGHHHYQTQNENGHSDDQPEGVQCANQ